MSSTMHQVPFRGVGLECENYRVRLKGVLIEQDSEVHVVSVHPALIGDVTHNIWTYCRNVRLMIVGTSMVIGNYQVFGLVSPSSHCC